MALITFRQSDQVVPGATDKAPCNTTSNAAGTLQANLAVDSTTGPTLGGVVVPSLNGNTSQRALQIVCEPGQASWDAGDWIIPINYSAKWPKAELVNVSISRKTSADACTTEGTNGEIGTLVVGNVEVAKNPGIDTRTVTCVASTGASSDRAIIILLFDNAGGSPNDGEVTFDQDITSPIVASGAGNVNIAVPTKNFVLSTAVPSIVIDVTVSVPTKTLTLVGFVPGISVVNLNVPTKNFTLTAFLPSLVTTVSLDVPARNLVLSTFVPVVQSSVTLTVPMKALTLTAFAPDLASPVTITINPATKVLGLTAFNFLTMEVFMGSELSRLFRVTIVNPGDNWFVGDLKSVEHATKYGAPVRVALSMMVSIATVVNLIVKENAVSDVKALNQSNALAPNSLYIFEFHLYDTQTFNIQHVTGPNLLVSCDVNESRVLTIGG